jgi:serine protease AprX
VLVAFTGASTYGVSMVAAGKGGGGGGGGGGTQACSNLSNSLTPSQINSLIGADRYHNLKGKSAITGAGIDVAVIDTGVNAVAGTNVIDGPDLSFDALHDNLRHRDLHGHGTNMAGIVAANYGSYRGVAPGSRIVNVKVGAGDGAVDVSQVIAAIDWVVENRSAAGLNIRVINLAYSTDAASDYQTDPLAHAVENAWRNGIVVVAAGGNDGRGIRRLGNPARDPYVIAVGASEWDFGAGKWKIPAFTSTGDGIRNPDLVAPGTNVLGLAVSGSHLATTHPSATCVDGDGLLKLRGSGTSQAASVVAGAVAMLLQQRPELTPDQVKALLTSTAVNLGQPANVQGSGVLNLGAAIVAPTPSLVSAIQWFPPSTRTGTLEASRGSFHVGTSGDELVGELTAFGEVWDSLAHTVAQVIGMAWTDQDWSGGTWSGGTWSGSTWSGSTWSGSTWSGSTWSGSTWSGSTWSGSTWSGSTWSGSTWS